MIDFEALITKHAADDGTIPAANIPKIVTGISSAVGREFVPKDRYNAKLDEISQLEQAKQTAEDDLNKAKTWEQKYTAVKEQFDAFKTSTEAKAKLDTLKAAYRKLLTDEGIAPKYLDTVIRATQFDAMKLDAQGNLENADALKTAIGKEWSDFKASTHEKGADVDNPPKDNPGNDANPRAAERARSYYERRYGKPAESNNKE